jgi:ATP-dependent exoDNAse (exonuclease V) beta subunit
MSSLTVYRASAGSGKTFKLTQQYLVMVLRNPERYRNILAVTFTNKATAEMKTRIIDELYNLSEAKESKHAKILKSILELNDHQLMQQAKRALRLILHDYSRFSVSTIDHFFQRVIRNFAYEIGLQAGYNLEMDQSEILDYVIDELLLATSEDDQLKNWLVEFAQSRIQEGKSWDFRNEILALAWELSNEQVKALNLDMNDSMKNRDVLVDYVKKLNKIISSFENGLKKYGENGVQEVEQAGLTAKDFKYTGNAVNWFYYLKNKKKDKFEPKTNTRKGLEGSVNWPKPKLDEKTKDVIQNLAEDHLIGILEEAVEFYENNSKQYFSALEIKRNIYVLGIMTDIQKRMNDYCKEKNIFLISDAADLLRNIIGDNEAPFVYEKTGSIYRHFMIDEFQDTSRFQWENFKPLIHNSLSENGRNIIVGDIKQSIYRWRNSDWKILSDEVHSEFVNRPPDMKFLDRNYRSTQNIVAYNNTLFSFVPSILQEKFNGETNLQGPDNPWNHKLNEAYEDVLQGLPFTREGGYVRHEGITYKKGDIDEAKQQITERVIKDIENLQDHGYSLSDMAILVRKNSEGQEIANAILEYKNSSFSSSQYQYDVISNDSLYIRNAESVKLIIALFRYLINPADQINKTFIKEMYHRVILNEDYHSGNIHGLFSDNEGFDQFVPKDFIDNLEQLKRTPIYELVERLIHIFDIQSLNDEIPYIQAFQNIILDFSRRNASDVSSFINWWDTNGSGKKLQLPENYDAIRIITIHKAKGLEFKAVIIPYSNWELDNPSSGIRKNFIWSQPNIENLDDLGAVPVNYKASLANTIFAGEYYSELFHNYVDNLNLLYVAFTRAEEVLISYIPLQVTRQDKLNYIDKGNGVTHVGELLHFVHNNQFTSTTEDEEKPLIKNLRAYWNEERLTFEWGAIHKEKESEYKERQQLKIKEYPSYKEKPSVSLKYEHTEFFKETPDLLGRVDYGKIMHQIFELIEVEDDLDFALEQVYFEGKINGKEKDELKNQIKGLFRNENVKSWFSGEWKVFSERDILLPNGNIYRPDRVMMNENETVIVDYKFGEKQARHKKQVNFYQKQLQQMGYKNIIGYLWYVSMNQIEKVEKNG